MTIQVLPGTEEVAVEIRRAAQAPKFRDESELTEEQLTDPDYRLKQLAKLSDGKFSITCSKCHHCRR